MKAEFASAIFANLKSFGSSINKIYQTFNSKDFYPTLEENVLYLITKKHSFSNENKGIAASCFLYFLNKNNTLYKKIIMKQLVVIALNNFYIVNSNLFYKNF